MSISLGKCDFFAMSSVMKGWLSNPFIDQLGPGTPNSCSSLFSSPCLPSSAAPDFNSCHTILSCQGMRPLALTPDFMRSPKLISSNQINTSLWVLLWVRLFSLHSLTPSLPPDSRKDILPPSTNSPHLFALLAPFCHQSFPCDWRLPTKATTLAHTRCFYPSAGHLAS